MKYTFVHAADLHLDTPFEGLGRVNEALAARLRDASLEAWDRLVALTLERNAAFLLLAGDIYDGAARGLRAQLRFHAGLDRLSRAGIDTFIIHGNHDPLDGWSAITRWPERVTVFGPDSVAAVPVEREAARIATVYGISYGTRDVAANLALGFQREDAPGVHIGMLHGTVTNAVGVGDHGCHSPCTLPDLLAAGMDYWALGHIHRRATLRAGTPWVVYAGNLQGRSMKPSERGAKGATVVSVRGGAIEAVEFVACDRVRFGVAELSTGELPDLRALEEALLDALQRLGADAAGRDVLGRVRLTGRGALSGELRRHGVLPDLLRSVQDTLDAASRGVWCERIDDATRPLLEREQIRARGDLSAEVLRRVDALAAKGAGADFVAASAQPIAAAGLAELGADELEALLEDAVELALGMLEREEAQ